MHSLHFEIPFKTGKEKKKFELFQNKLSVCGSVSPSDLHVFPIKLLNNKAATINKNKKSIFRIIASCTAENEYSVINKKRVFSKKKYKFKLKRKTMIAFSQYNEWVGFSTLHHMVVILASMSFVATLYSKSYFSFSNVAIFVWY